MRSRHDWRDPSRFSRTFDLWNEPNRPHGSPKPIAVSGPSFWDRALTVVVFGFLVGFVVVIVLGLIGG